VDFVFNRIIEKRTLMTSISLKLRFSSELCKADNLVFKAMKGH